MEMNFKLKTLVAVLALSAAAATTANAATNPTGANGSSVIFSAWDDVVDASYTFDIGLYLDNFIGADTTGGLSSNNTLAASGSTYTGVGTGDGHTIATIALTGFNLTSGYWNLVAADGTSRKRVLTTNFDPAYSVTTNSQVAGASNAVNSFIGAGAAASASTGTLSDSSKVDYAGGSLWGDDLSGKAGFAGSSNVLGEASNLFVTWQKSVDIPGSSGLANLTYNGNNVFATTYSLAGVTYLNIAAVPETDTSGMMLAGLGLMGFIARRRNSKQA